MIINPVEETSNIEENIEKIDSIESLESENAPYAIVSETWYSDWYEHVYLDGYHPNAPFFNQDLKLHIDYMLHIDITKLQKNIWKCSYIICTSY